MPKGSLKDLASLVNSAIKGPDPMLLRAIEKMAVDDIQKNFTEGGSADKLPNGNNWPALAESTQERKVTKSGRKRGGEHILIVSGKLRRSVQAVTERTGRGEVSLITGSNMPYAATHNFGDNRGKRRIPRRTFLAVSQMVIDRIGNMVAKNMAEKLGS